jgi:hypothetical protein
MRIAVQAGLGKKQGQNKKKAIAKISRAQRAGAVAQVVVCLPSKHKALSSTPSPLP